MLCLFINIILRDLSSFRAAYAASEVSKLQRKVTEEDTITDTSAMDSNDNASATHNSSSSKKDKATSDDKATKLMMGDPGGYSYYSYLLTYFLSLEI